MSDIVERLRRIAKELPQTSGNQAWLRPEDTTVWEAADEIEKLRAAICEWAASIYGYEGVLFLEGLKHEEFINSILDEERDRVEAGEKQ
jgi:hypothetical protein